MRTLTLQDSIQQSCANSWWWSGPRLWTQCLLFTTAPDTVPPTVLGYPGFLTELHRIDPKEPSQFIAKKATGNTWLAQQTTLEALFKLRRPVKLGRRCGKISWDAMANINLVLAFRLDIRKWNMKIWIPSGRECELVSQFPAMSFSYIRKGKTASSFNWVLEVASLNNFFSELALVDILGE